MDGTARTLFQGMVCCLAILFKRFLTIKKEEQKIQINFKQLIIIIIINSLFIEGYTVS
jgi:hypothetical protein